MPLHTTKNYNGQLTGQDGIHGLWETSVPELSALKYQLGGSRASYVEKPLDLIWSMVYESNREVRRVLYTEDSLSRIWVSSKFGYSEKGRLLSRNYNPKFVATYESALEGMVEQKLKKSIQFLGNLIFTAWVDAGQPDLPVNKAIDVIESEQDSSSNSGNLRDIRAHE